MAPHDTNTRKEARRHAVPLIAMALVVIFAVGLIFWWLGDALGGNGDVPNAPDSPASEAPPAAPSPQ
ncbi:MAG TPA: hypothetical protein VFN28_05335 [Amaricoccus sp.]|nr:hypothetical protein [Amaricoccus sp.]